MCVCNEVQGNTSKLKLLLYSGQFVIIVNDVTLLQKMYNMLRYINHIKT